MLFAKNESLEDSISRNVYDALSEDLGAIDWTAMLVPDSARVTATIAAKQEAVFCGKPWAEEALRLLDKQAIFRWFIEDGSSVGAGAVICQIEAKARPLLSAERTMLNFLQMLSSVATMTRTYVDAIAGASPNHTGCAILDTRKTQPGLRQAQKYAVRVGGGTNHRLALWDGILIKENHIAAAGGIAAALGNARNLKANVPIQIEVEDMDELIEALEAGADNILIDDFSIAQMRQAVQLNARRAILEVSGGVNLSSIREIASTGVDRISVGKLTKDICAVDFSMRVSR